MGGSGADMTSVMIVRFDQLRAPTMWETRWPGCRTALAIQLIHRGRSPPPSVITVLMSDMNCAPRPNRHGSMWVCSSGWIEEVIATPSRKSRSSGLPRRRVAAQIASEFVRVSCPRRGERFGRAPSADP